MADLPLLFFPSPDSFWEKEPDALASVAGERQ